jgi:hypothetical protein
MGARWDDLYAVDIGTWHVEQGHLEAQLQRAECHQPGGKAAACNDNFQFLAVCMLERCAMARLGSQ